MRTPRAFLWVLIFAAIAGTAFILRGQSVDQGPVAAALPQALAQKPRAVRPAAWNDVRKFYELRRGSLAWLGGRNFAQVQEALRLVRRAPEHGLVSADYDEAELAAALDRLEQGGGADDPNRARQLAELDVRVTSALLGLGRDVALGRTSPDRLDPRWKSRRGGIDLPASLNQCAQGALNGWLDELKPRHPQYARLQKSLAGLYTAQNTGGWPKVSAKSLRSGASGPAVASMRERLSASGDLQSNAAASDVYDEDLETAVRSFQYHNHLPENGVADAATIAAMNVPLGARIQQVALNLERWRWMPDDLGPRHILVNIPEYQLHLFESGKDMLPMKVVVGRANGRRRTPVFSATMTTVIFSPYWNIPDTIVDGEVVPAMAKDPGYLAKQNIDLLRVTKSGATVVDSSSVNWDDPEELKQLAFRQRPGSDNALGHVKFLLPNPFDVYLHDTPAEHLFERLGRAFSHGCIRLEEPEALAKYVLRDQPEWDEARMQAAMHGGVETPVKIKQPLPVHIAYFTATVDEQGGLHFFKDVYRYDR